MRWNAASWRRMSCAACRSRRHRSKETRADRRQKGRRKTGVDIPAPGEVRAIIGKLEGRWRPLLLTAIFSGLRASELRGLRWADLELKRGEIHVAATIRCSGPPQPKPSTAPGDEVASKIRRRSSSEKHVAAQKDDGISRIDRHCGSSG
jgi:hypothetical protein